MIAQREQHVLAGIAGGVFALRREWKFIAGTEDMAVRIDRAGRRSELRRLRIVEPVEPSRRLFKSG